MVEDEGRPNILLVDVRPISYPLAVVNAHAVAEQISRVSRGFPTSVNKSPTIFGFTRLIGHESVLSKEVCVFTRVDRVTLLCNLTQYCRVMLGRLSEKGSILDLLHSI